MFSEIFVETAKITYQKHTGYQYQMEKLTLEMLCVNTKTSLHILVNYVKFKLLMKQLNILHQEENFF